MTLFRIPLVTGIITYNNDSATVCDRLKHLRDELIVIDASQITVSLLLSRTEYWELKKLFPVLVTIATT
jgi:hypothetical protein